MRGKSMIIYRSMNIGFTQERFLRLFLLFRFCNLFIRTAAKRFLRCWFLFDNIFVHSLNHLYCSLNNMIWTLWMTMVTYGIAAIKLMLKPFSNVFYNVASILITWPILTLKMSVKRQRERAPSVARAWENPTRLGTLPYPTHG